jgi:hypothetical protein
MADLAALASLPEGQGMYEEAEQIYQRVLPFIERIGGPENYDVAINLNNLAAWYACFKTDMRRRSPSIAGIDDEEKLFGADHSLAQVYQKAC